MNNEQKIIEEAKVDEWKGRYLPSSEVDLKSIGIGAIVGAFIVFMITLA